MTFWDLKRTSFNFYKIYNLTIPTSFRNLPSVHITTLFTVIFDRQTECVYLLECDKILNVNEMHMGNSGDTHRCRNGASVTYMHMYETLFGSILENIRYRFTSLESFHRSFWLFTQQPNSRKSNSSQFSDKRTGCERSSSPRALSALIYISAKADCWRTFETGDLRWLNFHCSRINIHCRSAWDPSVCP